MNRIIAHCHTWVVINELPRRRPYTMSAASKPNTLPEAPMVGTPVLTFDARKPAAPATLNSHERPRGPVDLGRDGTEVSNPHYIENDVQQSAMQVDSREECPPPAQLPCDTTRHPELVECTATRRQQRHQTSGGGDRFRLQQQGHRVEADTGNHNQRDEVEMAPHETLEHRRPPEQAGPPRATEGTLRLVDPDELVAVRADDRPLRLPHTVEHTRVLASCL